ncbi:uncharacterized protein LOC112454740 isoform X2 [Temnothorax curvispinosus]|nr:uncharacterized protein LOC112454740 isoform X2 [Temnothorax curvispinosus]
MAHTREPRYLTVDDSDDDDITFLGEQKCSPIKSCAQLNGTHKKQPQHYDIREVMYSSCKSTCSPLHHSKSPQEFICHSKHRMPDTCHKSGTLSKTNQLKEKYQYEEMLQKLLPENKVRVFDKRTEYTPRRKSIEVIDSEKQSEILIRNNKSHSSVADIPKTMTPSYHRSSMSNCTRIDKEIVPTSNYRIDKDVMVYLQSNKIIPIDKPSTSGAVRRAPASKLPIKVAAANLLRDELAAKAVIMQDFIPQVNKKDDERIKQRNREAEELKKMTCVLSKLNRYVRNAALEEQLARSMKFCMTVLEDRKEPEEQ